MWTILHVGTNAWSKLVLNKTRRLPLGATRIVAYDIGCYMASLEEYSNLHHTLISWHAQSNSNYTLKENLKERSPLLIKFLAWTFVHSISLMIECLLRVALFIRFTTFKGCLHDKVVKHGTHGLDHLREFFYGLFTNTFHSLVLKSNHRKALDYMFE